MYDTYDMYQKLSDKTEAFTITDQHLLLMRNVYIEWNECEFGAPSVNPKRPYGNSNVLRGILELLYPESRDWDDERREDYLDDDYNILKLTNLHVETGIALNICLQRGAFEPGLYRKVNWRTWEKAE